MAVGKNPTATTLNDTTIARLNEFDRFVNDPGLATLINWWAARTVGQVKTDAPGFAGDGSDDTKLGQLRGAVIKLQEARDAWNNASTGGQPLLRFLNGIG